MGLCYFLMYASPAWDVSTTASAGAVHMEFMGKEVYGYYDFLERNRLQIRLPDELRNRVGSL